MEFGGRQGGGDSCNGGEWMAKSAACCVVIWTSMSDWAELWNPAQPKCNSKIEVTSMTRRKVVVGLVALLVLEEAVPIVGAYIYPIEEEVIFSYISNLRKPFIPSPSSGVYINCLYTPAFLFYNYEMCVSTPVRENPSCGLAMNGLRVRNPTSALGIYKNHSADRMMLYGYMVTYFNENGEICPPLGKF